MPIIRKLTPEEIEQLTKQGKEETARAKVAKEYDEFLSQFDLNEYGVAELVEGESKLTVRNRLTAAADRRGLAVKFIRTSGETVRFQLQLPQNGEITGNSQEEEQLWQAAEDGGSEMPESTGNSQEDKQIQQAEGPATPARSRRARTIA